MVLILAKRIVLARSGCEDFAEEWFGGSETRITVNFDTATRLGRQGLARMSYLAHLRSLPDIIWWFNCVKAIEFHRMLCAVQPGCAGKSLKKTEV